VIRLLQIASGSIMADRAGVTFDATGSAFGAQRSSGKIEVFFPEEDGIPVPGVRRLRPRRAS
jgi:hypothetical protein